MLFKYTFGDSSLYKLKSMKAHAQNDIDTKWLKLLSLIPDEEKDVMFAVFACV